MKIHPDLAVLCLRDKRDREYRLWTLARELDAAGSGRVPLDRLIVFASTLRGLSPGTVRRLLDVGDGTFWDRYTKNGRRWLQLRGLAKVCEALGVEKLRRDPVLLPDRYARTLRAWRAALYSSQFTGDWSKPISRRTLEELTGRSARTQRYYQAAMRRTLQARQNGTPTETAWKRGEPVPDGCFVDLVNGKATVLKRLPNSYRTSLRQGQRGMLRQANRLLNAGHSLRREGRETRTQTDKLFYLVQHSALRRLQAREPGDQFFLVGAEMNGKPTSKSRGGTVLWSRLSVCEDRVYCG